MPAPTPSQCLFVQYSEDDLWSAVRLELVRLYAQSHVWSELHPLYSSQILDPPLSHSTWWRNVKLRVTWWRNVKFRVTWWRNVKLRVTWWRNVKLRVTWWRNVKLRVSWWRNVKLWVIWWSYVKLRVTWWRNVKLRVTWWRNVNLGSPDGEMWNLGSPDGEMRNLEATGEKCELKAVRWKQRIKVCVQYITADQTFWTLVQHSFHSFR